MSQQPSMNSTFYDSEKPATFLGLLRYSRFFTGSAIITAIIAAALSIAPFYVISLIAGELLKPTVNPTRLWYLAGVATGLVLLRWIFVSLSDMLAHKGAFTILFTLRKRAAQKLGEVPLSFFASQSSGKLRRTLYDDIDSLESLYAHILPNLSSAPIVSLSALILLFFADWRLAIIVLIPLPIAFFAQWWMTRGMGDDMREWIGLQQKISGEISEFIRGVHVIKSFGLDTRSFGNLSKTIHNAVDWAHSFAARVTRSFMTFAILLRGNLVLVAPIGAIFYVNGSLDAATFVLFLLLSPLVLEPLLTLSGALHEKMNHIEAMDHINEVLTAKPLIENHNSKTPEGPYEIVFDDVSYSYGKRLAIDHVSFNAKADKVTALVGPSGSGKSTLLKLVARLYEFDHGHLTIGGLNVRDWRLDDLLDKTSIVFQDVVLLYGTVADNLRIAKPDASDEELKEACRLAKADGFIEALPQGYDTLLQERGSQLSGGERQRLSIARAFLKNAPILLLDEPTSSLDPENENLIHEALETLYKNRTVLIVGHHLQNLVSADKIIVMDHGRLAGEGRHEELLKNCPTYRILWQDQLSAGDWSLGEEAGEAEEKTGSKAQDDKSLSKKQDSLAKKGGRS